LDIGESDVQSTQHQLPHLQEGNGGCNSESGKIKRRIYRKKKKLADPNKYIFGKPPTTPTQIV